MKCTTVGQYSYISHTVFFPRAHCSKRTDSDFRSKQDNLHHKNDTPLTKLPIDMIEAFPVGDPLHLIDLGIMKRSLLGWRDGSFGTYKTKWCVRDIEKITQFLLNCKMPREIHRSVRGVDCLPHWKGLEYRTFLLYTSIVALKPVLSLDIYEHFLAFFCAVTICSSKQHFKYLNLAEVLLDHYVEYYRDYYGEDYISSNVHNLLHVVDEVRRFGELSSFSTYPFESRLYEIKNLLRNGNRPLAQVAKRITEMTYAETEHLLTSPTSSKCPSLSKKSGSNFLKIDFQNFILSAETSDKWFLTGDGQIVEMLYAIEENSQILIQGRSLQELQAYFQTPVKSTYLNIYAANELNKHTPVQYSIEDVKCKLVAVKSNLQTVFIPLLHTYI